MKLIGIRVRVIGVVEPMFVLEPFLVSRVHLTCLASKQQAPSSKHARTGEKSQLHRGPSDSANVLTDATYGCEAPPHKV